jgi:hypothetical protein
VMMACMGIGFTPHLSAQSADIFQSLHDTTQNAVGDLTKSPIDIELLKSRPSRFATDHIKQYTVARIADLSMNDRATDPFGLVQDTELTPKPERPTNNNPVGKPPIAPLQDIVNQIAVSAIMVKEKSFLSQGQVFKESMEFTIGAGDRTKRLKVLKVDEAKIVFKDLDSDEQATLKRKVLPSGVFVGGDRLTPDGMASPAKHPHIQLDIK